MDTKLCKKCNETKSVDKFYPQKGKNGKMYVSTYCKPCNTLNMKEYYSKNPGKHYEHHNKSYRKETYKIPPAVYGIYQNDKLIYVGESSTPKRRVANHFSKYSNLKNCNNSAISYAISVGKLKRKNLSSKIIKYIDDENERKELEAKLIAKHKPKYNTIGC